jgi:AcrR family transcriptional regulator
MTLVQEKGSITMEEVAKLSGVSKGTLYNYFENKECLISYVHDSITLPLINNIEKSLSGPKTPKEKLHEFIDEMFKINDDVCSYFKFVDTQRTADDVSKEIAYYIIEPLAKVIQEGTASGVFVDADPYILAHSFFGMSIGVFSSPRYREVKSSGLLALKEEVLKLVNRLIIKQLGRDSL